MRTAPRLIPALLALCGFGGFASAQTVVYHSGGNTRIVINSSRGYSSGSRGYVCAPVRPRCNTAVQVIPSRSSRVVREHAQKKSRQDSHGYRVAIPVVRMEDAVKTYRVRPAPSRTVQVKDTRWIGTPASAARASAGVCW